MFKSAGSQYALLPALLSLGALALFGCDEQQHSAVTADQVARFKYCSGFTSAAEFAAHRNLIEVSLAETLRAQQLKAAERLALQPREMEMGTARFKADSEGNVQTSTTTEVGRGMEEGAVMVDGKEREKLLETIRACGDLFKSLAE